MERDPDSADPNAESEFLVEAAMGLYEVAIEDEVQTAITDERIESRLTELKVRLMTGQVEPPSNN